MPTGVTVACDCDECLAVCLGLETGDDEDARSASELSDGARRTSGSPKSSSPPCPDQHPLHGIDGDAGQHAGR
jgi:hypothetical protein